MEKIESLTSEQSKELAEFKNEWLDIGLCTDRADKEKATNAIKSMYRMIDKPIPYFWYCDSPFQANVFINLLKNAKNIGDNIWDNLWANLEDNLWANLSANLGANLEDNLRANLEDNLSANLRANLEDNIWDNLRANLEDNLWDNLWANLEDNLSANLRANLEDNIWDNLWANLSANLRANLEDNLRANLRYEYTDLWGQMDAYWIAFYLFPHNKLREMHDKKDMEILNLWADLAKSCSWWYPYGDICFVSDRPNMIKKDDEGRLHCEDGPALSFIDGYEVYVWHGTNIPSEWIQQPETLTTETALHWENIEQRRCACEILGWHKILDHLNAVTIDAHQNPEIGKLMEVDLPDSGKERFLMVQCGTGRQFAIPVPPELNTAHEANAWTYGLTADEYQPEVRT